MPSMANIPPTQAQFPMPRNNTEAYIHNSSILEVRGIKTTATGLDLYLLAQDALQNVDIHFDPLSPADRVGTTTTTTAGPSDDDDDDDNHGSVTSSNDDDEENEDDNNDIVSTCIPSANNNNSPAQNNNEIITAFKPFYFFFYGTLRSSVLLRHVIGVNTALQQQEQQRPQRVGTIKGWKAKSWGPFKSLVLATNAEVGDNNDDDADNDNENSVIEGLVWYCESYDDVRRLVDYETSAYRLAYCDVYVPTADDEWVDIIPDARVFVSNIDEDEEGENKVLDKRTDVDELDAVMALQSLWI